MKSFISSGLCAAAAMLFFASPASADPLCSSGVPCPNGHIYQNGRAPSGNDAGRGPWRNDGGNRPGYGYDNRRRDGHWRGRRDDGWDGGGAVIGGLAVGGLLGGALAAPQPYDDAPPQPYYDAPPQPYYDGAYVVPPDDPVAYCMARYRSYDPSSGTYLGYDGYRHSCP